MDFSELASVDLRIASVVEDSVSMNDPCLFKVRVGNIEELKKVRDIVGIDRKTEKFFRFEEDFLVLEDVYSSKDVVIF